MEPVKGGSLAKLPEELEQIYRKEQPNLSIASWGIRFAASLPHVLVVLSGMSNMEQVEDNASYMKDFQPLSGAEQDAVKTGGDRYQKQNHRGLYCLRCLHKTMLPAHPHACLLRYV